MKPYTPIGRKGVCIDVYIQYNFYTKQYTNKYIRKHPTFNGWIRPIFLHKFYFNSEPINDFVAY